MHKYTIHLGSSRSGEVELVCAMSHTKLAPSVPTMPVNSAPAPRPNNT